MLKVLVDTGAGPYITRITVWKNIGLSNVKLETKHASLVAVNGEHITTHGLATSVAFNISGFEPETSFKIVQNCPAHSNP